MEFSYFRKKPSDSSLVGSILGNAGTFAQRPQVQRVFLPLQQSRSASALPRHNTIDRVETDRPRPLPSLGVERNSLKINDIEGASPARYSASRGNRSPLEPVYKVNGGYIGPINGTRAKEPAKFVSAQNLNNRDIEGTQPRRFHLSRAGMKGYVPKLGAVRSLSNIRPVRENIAQPVLPQQNEKIQLSSAQRPIDIANKMNQVKKLRVPVQPKQTQATLDHQLSERILASRKSNDPITTMYSKFGKPPIITAMTHRIE